MHVAEKIAEIHNLPFELVAQTTTAGAERLFSW
jgi:Tat protein secretion system quality control protein TatD with DNase activity